MENKRRSVAELMSKLNAVEQSIGFDNELANLLRKQIREVMESNTISLADLIVGKGSHYLYSVTYDGFGGDVISAQASSDGTVIVRTNTSNGIYLLEFENEEVSIELFKPDSITIIHSKPTEFSESNNGYDQFAELCFMSKV